MEKYDELFEKYLESSHGCNKILWHVRYSWQLHVTELSQDITHEQNKQRAPESS